jgi:hypothetical protein
MCSGTKTHCDLKCSGASNGYNRLGLLHSSVGQWWCLRRIDTSKLSVTLQREAILMFSRRRLLLRHPKNIEREYSGLRLQVRRPVCQRQHSTNRLTSRPGPVCQAFLKKLCSVEHPDGPSTSPSGRAPVVSILPSSVSSSSPSGQPSTSPSSAPSSVLVPSRTDLASSPLCPALSPADISQASH